jgi:site-specific DNA-cytosine methylase
MKVLVACEFSGIVREAFAKRGHDAWSCDLQDTEIPGNHYTGDVFDIINDGFDLMIAHPPCTYISYAGTRWWNDPGRCKLRLEALDFFRRLWEAPIEKICIENPRGCASPTIAKYSQVINPYYFGDEASKPTWLWLKNLPPLIHSKQDTLFEKKTHVSKGEFIYHVVKSTGKIKGDAKWYTDALKLSPKDRANLRSKTFQGIADAMVDQWGEL